MGKKLFEFSDLEILKRNGKLYARYDADSHQIAMREDEITEGEAKKAIQGNKEAMEMLFSLQKSLFKQESIRINQIFRKLSELHMDLKDKEKSKS